MRGFPYVAFALIILLPLAFVLTTSFTSAGSESKVESAVLEAFESENEVDVAVVLNGKGTGLFGLNSQSPQAKALSVVESLDEGEFSNEYSSPNSESILHLRVAESALAKLESNPNIEKVERSEPLKIILTDTVKQINASITWQEVISGFNLTGIGQSICIIDTGINYSHTSLGGCSNDSFIDGTCAKVIGGYDSVNEDLDPADDNGHGTHVAGIAAANGSVTGVAPGATLVALKACNSGGSCSISDIVQSIDWCVGNSTAFNISVISMSLGDSRNSTTYCDNVDSDTTSLAASINAAVLKNITVTVSSGNDGNLTGISSPACIRNATAVGSVSKADAFSSFGNRNNITDLMAPGASVTSTSWTGATASLSGTSMSAPHVAGAAAILQQARKLQTNSSFTKDEAESAMKNYGDNLTDNSGSGLNFTRVNVYKAVDSLTAPSFTFISKPNASLAGQNVTINLTAEDTFLGIVNATITINSTIFSMNISGDSYFFIYEVPDTDSIIYNVTFVDRVYSNTTENTVLVIGDTSAPTFGNISSQSLNYSTPSQFNISWSDNFGIETVFVEFDGINYTGGNITNMSSVYRFNLTSAVGSHNLTWHANDTSGNSNTTGRLEINITRADPNLNLTVEVNGTIFTANTINENGTDANITASSIGEGNILLFINGTLMNNGTSIISNLTDLGNGTFNFTAFYAQTENFSASSSALELVIESESAAPRAFKISPTNGQFLTSSTVILKINATDASLSNATLNLFNVTNGLISTNFTNLTGTFNQTNWSYSLSDGNYSWTALVVDSRGNQNFTDGNNFTFIVDTAQPTATISVSDTSIQTDEKTNIICTGTDINLESVEIFVDDSSKNSSSTNTTSYTFSSSSSGSKKASCRVEDLAGNVKTSNQTITVSSPSSSSSSSSGGGGSGGASTASTTTASSSKTIHTFAAVAAGDFARVKASANTKAETGVSQVSILLKNTVEDFTITLFEDKSPPEAIKANGEKVFKYVEIAHEKITDSDVSQVTISFEIPKAWFKENNALEDSAVLRRFKSGKWNDLETFKILESSTIVKYDSNSPGLSTFAIVAKASAPAAIPITGEAVAEEDVIETAAEEEKKQLFSLPFEVKLPEIGLPLIGGLTVLILCLTLIIASIIHLSKKGKDDDGQNKPAKKGGKVKFEIIEEFTAI